MIIAEFCANHMGDRGLLKDMVFKAADAGARFAKIQTFFADDLSDKWKHTYARVKSSELDFDAHHDFVTWCREANIAPMTSVYSKEHALRLWSAGFRWIKIGSAQAGNSSLINFYNTLDFNIVISTGGRDLNSVHYTENIAGILHCVSKYPHSPYESSMLRMLDIQKRWPNNKFGLSCHVDPTHRDWALPSFIAIYFGGTLVEKHFTIIDRDKTKDGCVSITPDQLREICNFEKLSKGAQETIISRDGAFSCMVKRDLPSQFELIKEYESRWKE